MYIYDLRHFDPSIRLIYTIVQTSNAIWKVLEEHISDVDINIAQFRILNVLLCHNQPLAPADICHCLHKESQTITVSINRLIEKGYVQKIKDEYDKRYVRIHITEKGKELLYKYNQRLINLVKEISDCFSDLEVQQFNNSLDKLYDHVFQILGVDIVKPISGFCGNPNWLDKKYDSHPDLAVA